MNSIKIFTCLGLAALLMVLGGCKTGNVGTMSTEHHAMPPGKLSSGPCGSYYELLVFNNAPNPGYCPPAGKTNFLVRLTDVDAGVDVPNTDYYLYYIPSTGVPACAANYGTNQKQFACTNPTSYVFQIFFKLKNNPPTGHEIYLYPSYLP